MTKRKTREEIAKRVDALLADDRRWTDADERGWRRLARAYPRDTA